MEKNSPVRVKCCRLIAFFCLLAPTIVYCQSVVSSGSVAATTASPLLTQFQQSQQTLTQQMARLGPNATPAQLTYWTNQNQSLIQASQTLAVQLAAATPVQPEPLITSITIPEGASQDLEDLLTTQANFANIRAQVHNQLLQGALSGNEVTLFEQQAGPALQEQAQRLQRIAAVANQQALPEPGPLNIPANATPALQAFLTLRDQLMRGEIRIHNQNLQADDPTREAALATWRQANASLVQQLHQLAQNLASSSSATSSQ